jgi:hypothetical protein
VTEVTAVGQCRVTEVSQKLESGSCQPAHTDVGTDWEGARLTTPEGARRARRRRHREATQWVQYNKAVTILGDHAS